MNLRSIDLNLLVVLDALIEERGVRRAGDRIGLSQAATSHALDRLRKLLGDEILVRTATGMEPTSRATALAGPLRLALQEIQGALAPEHFEPAQATQHFNIGVETHETIILLPRLVDEVRAEAPLVSLTIRPGSAEGQYARIDQGQSDMGIGYFRGLPDRFMTCRLMGDRHVCVMRADHPLAHAPLTLDAYLQAPHLLVSMSGTHENVVDASLASLGLRRRVVMSLPHGLAALIALSRSDMITTVTRGAAQEFAKAAPLMLADLPFPMPRTEFRLIWNRRHQQSAAHQWLRQKLVAIGALAEVTADA